MKDSFLCALYIAALPRPRTMATSIRAIELVVTVCHGSRQAVIEEERAAVTLPSAHWDIWRMTTRTSPHIKLLPNEYLISSSAL